MEDKNLKLLEKRLRGGQVLRYHTRPEIMNGQNVAAHTWKTVVILHTLWPDVSKNTLLHMLYHDVAEFETGDMPATTKWKYDELAQIMNRVESDYEDQLGIGENTIKVSPREKSLCDMADKLELVFHCHRLLKEGNTHAEDVFIKGYNYLRSKYKNNKDFKIVVPILEELAKTNPRKDSIQDMLEKLYSM
jgi:5'-deoxynucleotidase YfbR-like HD superfamily hydrolase